MHAPAAVAVALLSIAAFAGSEARAAAGAAAPGERRDPQVYRGFCGFGPEACPNLTAVFRFSEAVIDTSPETIARAAERFCRKGDAFECNMAGWCFSAGKGVRRDARRAAVLYEKGCTLGSYAACVALAEMAETSGHKLRAAQLLRTACEQDGRRRTGPACSRLGWMYFHGDPNGMAKDEVEAASLYRKACAAGDAAGCGNLGVLYELGRGVDRDRDRAAAFYRLACENEKESDGAACWNLGRLHLEGDATSDPAKAAVLRRAGEANSTTLCDVVVSADLKRVSTDRRSVPLHAPQRLLEEGGRD